MERVLTADGTPKRLYGVMEANRGLAARYPGPGDEPLFLPTSASAAESASEPIDGAVLPLGSGGAREAACFLEQTPFREVAAGAP